MLIELRRWRFARLWRDRRGVSYIEICVALPVLVLLFLGGYEGWRLITARSKAETAAHVLADLVSQSDTSISEAEITSLLRSVELIIQPYSLSSQARAVVSIATTGAGTSIQWQRCTGGAAYSSRVGVAGGVPNFQAAGLKTPPTGATVIIAEVAINFTPVFLTRLFPAHQFKRTAMLRGRLRAPVVVNPGGTVSSC